MAAGVGSSMRYLGGIAGVAVLGRLLDLSGSTRERSRTRSTRFSAVFVGVLVVSVGLRRRCSAAARSADRAGKPRY